MSQKEVPEFQNVLRVVVDIHMRFQALQSELEIQSGTGIAAQRNKQLMIRRMGSLIKRARDVRLTDETTQTAVGPILQRLMTKMLRFHAHFD